MHKCDKFIMHKSDTLHQHVTFTIQFTNKACLSNMSIDAVVTTDLAKYTQTLKSYKGRILEFTGELVALRFSFSCLYTFYLHQFFLALMTSLSTVLFVCRYFFISEVTCLDKYCDYDNPLYKIM